ncbi:MAG: isoprenylcysteine carboxylmethyltransferase family protein [Alphaproteobacteria bacterium]|nr:isoprenylcysteine carboxylmethyltransferase family protein [Alphaproteobacteria bacterium]
MSGITPLDVCGWLWMAIAFYWVVAAQFAYKTRWVEGLARLQHTVPTTLGLIMLFHRGGFKPLDWGIFYHNAFIGWAGVAVTALSLAFGVWARLHIGKYWSGTVTLKKEHKIIDTGPYRYVRHPIYTALLTAALGTAMAAARREAFVAVVLLVAGYIVKLKREEKLMLGEFGTAYADYMKRTKALYPFIY